MLKKFILACIIVFNVAVTVQAQSVDECQEQISAYTNEIKINKKDSNLYFKRAEMYVQLYKLNDDKKALSNARKDYTQAIKLNKNFTEAYFKRGQLYNYSHSVEKIDEAYNDFSKVIKLEPDNIVYKEAYVGRAQICYAEYTDINLEYVLAVSKAPSKIISNLLKQSIEDYTKAIEFDETNWEYYFNRGKAYTAKKDYESAITDYNKAIELNSAEPVIYLERGQLYEKIQIFDKALADYETIIEAESAVNFVRSAAREGIERINKTNS